MGAPAPSRSWIAALAVLLSVLARPVRAGLEPEEVLVVVNDSSTISVAIGDFYQALRGIPAENVFHLPLGTSTAETISRATYDSEVRDPIRTYLETTAPHLREQILCIVTTKGVPLRVSGSNSAAVDSELTQLFTGSSIVGAIPNRYLGRFVDFRRFRDVEGHQGDISYLVTRITGYQTDVDPGTGVPADILALMNRSVAPPPQGAVFLLDQDPTRVGGFEIGNIWMEEARDALDALGEVTVLDDTTTFVRNQDDIAGYVSWGSNDCCDPGPPYYGEVPVGSGNVFPGTLLARSIVSTYVSTNGRTFTDGNQNYGQSLVADLVHEGACGGGGHVFEPFLNAVPQPQLLFPAYVRGFSAAEAYYMSIASLSWMNTIVVDPLMLYQDFSGPALLSVDPPEGTIEGGDTVTLTGLEFREDLTVTFDGVPAADLTWIGIGTLEAVTPPGAMLGPVDVTVANRFGSDTLVGGFRYTPLPVDLQISDTSPGLGDPVDFTVSGPPFADLALLADLRSGKTCVLGGRVCFDLAFSGKLTVFHDSIRGSDAPLDETGRRAIGIVVPDKPALVGRFIFVQGVVDKDGSGDFEVTPLGILLVTE